MKKRIKNIGIIVVVFLVLAVGSVFFSKAQSTLSKPLNITVSPSVFDLTAKPGTTIKNRIRMRNNEQVPIRLEIEVRKLSAANTQGDSAISEFAPEDEYKDWIKLSTTSLVARAQEWIDIPFEITIPEYAGYGYYWAFYITPGAPQTDDEAQSQYTGAVALPVLVAVQNGDTTIQASIADFKTDATFYEYHPVNFFLTFQNLSKVHVKPVGNIFIYNGSGKEIEALKVNNGAGNVLPDSSRDFETVWNNSFISYENKTENGTIVKDASGNAIKELQFHFDKILNIPIGGYKAKAVIIVNNGDKDIPFEATTEFTIVPWKPLIGIGLFVLLTLIGLIQTIRSIYLKVTSSFSKKL